MKKDQEYDITNRELLIEILEELEVLQEDIARVLGNE